MSNWLQDIRFSLRSLSKARGFTLAALLALALGIGANTAIFSVVNGVLLEPLPYQDEERIAMLWVQFLGQDLPESKLSPPEFVDFRDQTTAFEALAPSYDWEFNLTGDGEPARIKGAVASASLFEVLRTKPVLGRPFNPEEDTAGNDTVVVLSETLWRSRYGSDPDILGQTLTLNGTNHEVVGVMPASFQYPHADTELWLPLAFDLSSQGGRWAHYLSVVGRLADGVTLEEARTQVETVAQRIQSEYQPEGFYPDDSGWGAALVPLREQLVGSVKVALLVLFVAVSLVLLIACSNVANLLLARSEARSRELGVRAAIGAGRWRILRQMLTESMILALAGGVLGVLLAFWGVQALVALAPAEVPRLEHASLLNSRVLPYALGISILTGLLFGLLPAARATRFDLQSLLKEGGRSGGSGGRTIKRGLVVVEVALSLMLLVGAGLLIRSFSELNSIEPGFRPDNVLTTKLTLPGSSYGEDAQVVSFYERLVDRVETLPGVERAGVVSHLPLSGDRWTGNVGFDDRPTDPDGVPPEVDWRAVSDGYFEAMGIDLVRGRLIQDGDDTDSPQVAVIDERMAERFWPDGEPFTHRVRLGGADSSNHWREVVGVVETVKHMDLSEDSRGTVYVSHRQNSQSTMTLVVESQVEPDRQIGAVRSALGELDPDLPAFRVATMNSLLDDSLSAPRFNLLLLVILAAVALLLAILGIYAVISYSVRQRSHEIGIRMALGARRGRVVSMVVREGVVLTGLGLVLGVVGAIFLARAMDSLLFGIGIMDPVTFVGVGLIVLLTSIGASLIPARRASRLDPMLALRDE